MKTSANQARHLRPTISKIVMALAVASVMGGITISSALGQDNDSRARAGQDRGRNDDRDRNDNRGRNDDRDRNDNRDRNNDRDQREDRPVYVQPYYSEPVYAPPPVYYDAQPSPGINLFFPLDIRF